MAESERPLPEGATTEPEARVTAPQAPGGPVIDLTGPDGPVLDLTRASREAAPEVAPSKALDLRRDAVGRVIDLTGPVPVEYSADVEAVPAAEPEPVRQRGLRHLLGTARAGFRTWRRTRPFWAGVWTMLGGAIIAYVPGTAIQFVFSTTSIAIGVTVGVVIGVCGLCLWAQPQLRFLLGVVILVLSLVSFVTSDFGGFFVGMLLSIIGGALATAWVPAPVVKRGRHRRRRFHRALQLRGQGA
jgi:hypothetical protein